MAISGRGSAISCSRARVSSSLATACSASNSAAGKSSPRSSERSAAVAGRSGDGQEGVSSRRNAWASICRFRARVYSRALRAQNPSRRRYVTCSGRPLRARIDDEALLFAQSTDRGLKPIGVLYRPFHRGGTRCPAPRKWFRGPTLRGRFPLRDRGASRRAYRLKPFARSSPVRYCARRGSNLRTTAAGSAPVRPTCSRLSRNTGNRQAWPTGVRSHSAPGQPQMTTPVPGG